MLSPSLTDIQHLGAPNVIGLARLFCYRGTNFQLVEVPKQDARNKKREMAREGWIVTHTDLV